MLIPMSATAVEVGLIAEAVMLDPLSMVEDAISMFVLSACWTMEREVYKLPELAAQQRELDRLMEQLFLTDKDDKRQDCE